MVEDAYGFRQYTKPGVDANGDPLPPMTEMIAVHVGAALHNDAFLYPAKAHVRTETFG